jgi:hypothetical protein
MQTGARVVEPNFRLHGGSFPTGGGFFGGVASAGPERFINPEGGFGLY